MREKVCEKVGFEQKAVKSNHQHDLDPQATRTFPSKCFYFPESQPLNYNPNFTLAHFPSLQPPKSTQ